MSTRNMVEAALLATPQASDQEIAARLDVSPTWVGRVRRFLVRAGLLEIAPPEPAAALPWGGRRWGAPITQPIDAPLGRLDSHEVKAMLRAAVTGMEVGAFDRVVLNALAKDPRSGAVVASLVHRGRALIVGSDSYWLTEYLQRDEVARAAAGLAGEVLRLLDDPQGGGRARGAVLRLRELLDPTPGGAS